MDWNLVFLGIMSIVAVVALVDVIKTNRKLQRHMDAFEETTKQMLGGGE